MAKTFAVRDPAASAAQTRFSFVSHKFDPLPRQAIFETTTSNSPPDSTILNFYIMKLIDEIQDNTITKIRFTCEDDDVIDNIHQVISAVKQNSSILTVEMVDDFLGCVRNDARSELIQALGRIPCLQEARFEQGLVCIADIAELLCGVKGLKVLTLQNIVLQGIEDEFTAMEMALHQHQSIKEFSLEGCRPAVEEISIETLELTGQTQVLAHGGIPSAPHNPANARSA